MLIFSNREVASVNKFAYRCDVEKLAIVIEANEKDAILLLF